MKIQVKRIYEPAEASDGTRVLVDRLWPRGVSKHRASVATWAKAVAPSTALRQWFHADPDRRFADFSKRYAAELRQNPDAAALKSELRRVSGPITLLTAAKDPRHSHVPTLLAYLKGRG